MVLGICFEYIGDEELYIDNLETIIEFGKGIYFTEKLYDIRIQSSKLTRTKRLVGLRLRTEGLTLLPKSLCIGRKIV